MFAVTKCREIFVDVHVATGVLDEGIRDMHWNSDSYFWLMWLITQEDFNWTVIFIFMHSGPFVYISFWRRGDQSYQTLVFLNICPSGHEETRDCCPMRCWWVTSFFVFLHGVLHMRFSASLADLSLQVYRQLGAGCLGLKLQTNRLILTPCF